MLSYGVIHSYNKNMAKGQNARKNIKKPKQNKKK